MLDPIKRVTVREVFLAFALLGLGPTLGSQPVAAPAAYVSGKETFAADMATKHGLDRAVLIGLLDQATYDPGVIEAIKRPYESVSWPQYRARFVSPSRVERGIDYWDAHDDTFDRVEKRYGVPSEIIVAIIGVESLYGAYLGRHRVLDALTTLAFNYPPRADFFRRELEQFVLLDREEPVANLTRAHGSYAGALGKPQFIPSSYRAYAVDFDGDHQRDLWGSDADVIASVGHYLEQHGWRQGEAIALAVRPPTGVPADLPIAGKTPIEPYVSVGELRAAGFDISGEPGDSALATIVHLAGSPDEYWAGFNNFYAITRYNHSILYAMAVMQLAEAIRAGRARRLSARGG